MSERRANLAVDLDCPKCRGLGQRPRTLQIGYGPSANEITVCEPCKCVRVAPADDAPQPVHAPTPSEITITVNGRRFWTVPLDVIGHDHIVRLAGFETGRPFAITAVNPGGRTVAVYPGTGLALHDGTAVIVTPMDESKVET